MNKYLFEVYDLFYNRATFVVEGFNKGHATKLAKDVLISEIPFTLTIYKDDTLKCIKRLYRDKSCDKYIRKKHKKCKHKHKFNAK